MVGAVANCIRIETKASVVGVNGGLVYIDLALDSTLKLTPGFKPPFFVNLERRRHIFRSYSPIASVVPPGWPAWSHSPPGHRVQSDIVDPFLSQPPPLTPFRQLVAHGNPVRINCIREVPSASLGKLNSKVTSSPVSDVHPSSNRMYSTASSMPATVARKVPRSSQIGRAHV